MATRIPLRELKNQASAIVRRAEAGESFDVTVDGRLCAKLIPAKPVGPRTFVPVEEFLAGLEALDRVGTVGDIRADLDEIIDPEFVDPFARYA